MKVGIIGVGLMGHGIARNIQIRGGFALTFLDHPGNQPTQDLIDRGARAVGTCAAVADASDVIILCVTGSPQVESVLTQPDGILASLRPGTVVVDCSTALPSSTERMASLVVAAGGAFLDAPMTRLAKQAHEGTLNLLVGGEAAVLEKVRPVLASFTENIDHVGPVGFGHRMKLLHNFVSLGCMALIAEAAAQATDAGIDPHAFVEMLAKGGGGGIALQRIAPFVLNGETEQVAFTLHNATKDIDYYRLMAAEAGAAKTIADSVHASLAGAVRHGQGNAYVPELVRHLRQAPPTSQRHLPERGVAPGGTSH